VSASTAAPASGRQVDDPGGQGARGIGFALGTAMCVHVQLGNAMRRTVDGSTTLGKT